MNESPGEFDFPQDEASNKTLLVRGFGLFWEHKRLLVGAHLILLAIVFLGDYLLQGIGGNVLLGPFLLGMYKIDLAIVRNKETHLGELLAGFETFLPAFIANILIQVAFLIGLSLLVIPGLLVLLTYTTTYLFLLDTKPGMWDAMEASRKLVWGNRKRWLTLGIMILGINLAGLLFFVIGLIVTIPYTHLLITMAYDEDTSREADENRRIMPIPADESA